MNRIGKLAKAIYKWWMAFARAVGVVNATILLTIVYIVVIGPMSIISRILRKDLLAHRKTSGSLWRTKERISDAVDQARHQF